VISGWICGAHGRPISKWSAAAVLVASVTIASTGVAHAQPADIDDECQATAGPPGVNESASTEQGNQGNCDPLPPSPIVIVPPNPLLPILCTAGAICVP
jgi:hypothetical protein